MKRRNLWLVVLVVVLALVVAGCGKDGDDDDKKKDKDKVTEAVTPSEATPTDAPTDATPTPGESGDLTAAPTPGESGDPTATPTPAGAETIWPLTAPTDLGTIDLPETTEETVTVPDNGEEITLLRTDISKPRETVFPALKEDSWITANEGEFFDYYDEQGTWFVATQNGPRWAVKYTEGFDYRETGTIDSIDLFTGTTMRFGILYTTETDQFCNENAVSVDFCNVNAKDAETLENIRRIVKEVYSEPIAEVLLNITTDDYLKSDEPNYLYLSLDYSQVEYRFHRNVIDDGETCRIMFEVMVERRDRNDIKTNTFHESQLAEIPFTPNEMFDGNIGNIDFYGSPETFADQYVAAYPAQVKLVPAGSVPYYLEKFTAPDGLEIWKVEYHIGADMSPFKFDLEYGFCKTADTVLSGMVKITGVGYDYGGENIDNFKQQLVLMNKEMEIVFGVNPDIKWEDLTTENEQKWTGTIDREFAVLGEPWSGTVEITLGSRMGGQLHGEWIVKLEKVYTR